MRLWIKKAGNNESNTPRRNTMKATVDKSLCAGCGICTDICPEVFEMDGDLAIAKVEKVPAEAEDTCRDAAQQCPAEAIKIDEDGAC
jgi:ferredoxin